MLSIMSALASRSTTPASVSSMASNTPVVAQRRYRRNTLFHLPYSSGSCRHCEPMRAIHIMPSKKQRLSCAGRQPRPRSAASFSDEERRLARAKAATARRDGMATIIPSTLERWFTPETRHRRPDIVDRVAKSMRADDPAIHAAIWDMIASLDFAGQLGEIACPTLVMTGEADPICPPATAQVLHDGIAASCRRPRTCASWNSPGSSTRALPRSFKRVVWGREAEHSFRGCTRRVPRWDAGTTTQFRTPGHCLWLSQFPPFTLMHGHN